MNVENSSGVPDLPQPLVSDVMLKRRLPPKPVELTCFWAGAAVHACLCLPVVARKLARQSLDDCVNLSNAVDLLLLLDERRGTRAHCSFRHALSAQRSNEAAYFFRPLLTVPGAGR